MNNEANEKAISGKLKILYISIIAICVISLIVAIIIQLNSNTTDIKLGNESNMNTIDENKSNDYKTKFNEIFENKVNYLNNNSYKITKNYEEKEIIYTGYQIKENKINDYDLDVNIPYINIKNSTIDEFNEDIKEIFEKKAKSTLNSKNANVIYTVNYSAYITNNILSLVIRSTLKEGNNAQRDIIQTYNYDLSNQKEFTMDEILERKDMTKQEVNSIIREEIKKVQKNVEELSQLGYNVYPRDYTSDIYSINNVTEYFIGEDDALYIIFAYGNQNMTSEMDIVII